MATWTPESHVQSYTMMDEGDHLATVRSAEISKYKDKNQNEVIEITCQISDGEYAGRKVKVRRYTSEKALGMIASDLFALGVEGVSSDYETPTASEFVDAYNDAAGNDVIINVKHNADKSDPTKVYENYRFKKLS